METKSELYRTAFRQFLRKGTPPYLALKAAEPSGRYVWRTQEDDKVRPSHAENNGKIFDWNDPPPTGNPGNEQNCRCRAEPYVEGETEYAYQILLSTEQDTIPKWTQGDFLRHFYFGLERVLNCYYHGRKHTVFCASVAHVL